MPNQQRFEGPDLEALLDEVRDRFGADVAIVEANKIRKGGVGGFFARELFEVVVDVDGSDLDGRADVGPDPHAGAEPPRARTLLDLVDAVDDGPPPGHAPEGSIATLLARVAEARAEPEPPPLTTGPTMSTDGDAFAAVLDRIARSNQEAPPSRSHDDEDAPFRAYADAAPAERVAEPPAIHTAPGASPAPGLRERTPEPLSPSPGAVDLDALARLGLPTPMLATARPGTDRVAALLDLAERFPRAAHLPRTGGSVIALIGDRSGMAACVAWVQEHLGLPPERLMLAARSDGGVFPSARRIVDHEHAIAQRRSWRRTNGPTLVVVDEPVSVRGTGWAGRVLDALEPAAVWGVVDAHRKPEDVVAWAERIGGVDAVALAHTADTTSPAALLGTGLPVSLIDGATATPARWAAVLDERLLAA